ncbi:hypothetical protein [Cupriavidus sp. TMH.W2]|uniref:hypothetical protein n=1 Tax=Cupriavidus sp. TMH.W2 TaxID=3434465 RepID=UPI003D77D035
MIFTYVVIALIVLAVMALAIVNKGVLERSLYYLSGFFLGGDIQSRVALITPVGPNTFITATGDLVSYFSIRGAKRHIGPDDFDKLAERLGHQLRTILGDGTGCQHSVSIGYLSAPQGTKRVISEALNSSINTAARLGAGERAQEWFRQRIQLLSTVASDETVLMAAFTLRGGLAPKESERATAAAAGQVGTAAKAKAVDGSNADFSQTIVPVAGLLEARHEAMLKSMQHNFENQEAGLGLMIDKLDCAEAGAALGRYVNGSDLPGSWRPDLFGFRAPTASALQRKGDIAHAMPLPLARQLFTEPTIEVYDDFELCRRAGYWYGAIKMDVCPHEDPAPSFSTLMERIGKDFPIALSFEVSPNGLEFRKLDQHFAGFFGGFGTHNRALRDAWNSLKAIRGRGEYIAAIRVVCSTWSSSKEATCDQLAKIKMDIQNWGGSTASNESGDPTSLHVAAAPGLGRGNPAPFLPGPIGTFARMLPVFRPASPWTEGQLLLRTREGKPYPVGFGTVIQAFWGTLIFAPPGRGKSFLMNVINAGLAFSPGLSELPYMTIIDNGMSSSTLVDTLRAMLPASKRHQAVSIRLRNTPDFAINMFDTQLGADRPTERERDFQIAMVLAICPGLGEEGSRYVGAVIDAAYADVDRSSINAKRWQHALDTDISERLAAVGFSIDESRLPRVWEVVDKLFDMGDIHATTIAQRYAVPTLESLVAAARMKSVQDLYAKTPAKSGEMITDVFTRSISTAMREYALFSTTTRFDLGDARIVAIDLEEVVASTVSEESKRRAEMMILFARQLGAKNYFLKWEEVEPLTPDRYKAYQARRVKRLWETLKFLEYDEFHMASGREAVMELVVSDFRVGRKYNVVPLLSSQLLQDFPKPLRENATNFFILGVGSEEASHELATVFGLSESERRIITNECLGPTDKGAPIFGLFKTAERGDVSQLLYNSASSLERWAFNSSALDVGVRRAVVDGLGGDSWRALGELTKAFPSGTARRAIETARRNMRADEQADEDGIVATVARKLVERVIAKDDEVQVREAAEV